MPGGLHTVYLTDSQGIPLPAKLRMQHLKMFNLNASNDAAPTVEEHA
jgi:hypothetical protein